MSNYSRSEVITGFRFEMTFWNYWFRNDFATRMILIVIPIFKNNIQSNQK